MRIKKKSFDQQSSLECMKGIETRPLFVCFEPQMSWIMWFLIFWSCGGPNVVDFVVIKWKEEEELMAMANGFLKGNKLGVVGLK